MQSAMFILAAGQSKAGMTISSELFDAVGADLGPLPGIVVTENGGGSYSIFGQLPDGFQGTVRFYGLPPNSPADVEFLAATVINPEEQPVPSLNVAVSSVIDIVRGDDYTDLRAITLSNGLWPDLTTGGVVQLQVKVGALHRLDKTLTVIGPRTLQLSFTAGETVLLEPARYSGSLVWTTTQGQLTLDRVVLDATQVAT